ncbi:MAG: DUF4350 domain-containing protein [Acidobacteriota bacterium]
MKRSFSNLVVILIVLALIVLLNFIFYVDKRQQTEDERTGDRSSYSGRTYGTLAYYLLLQELDYQVLRWRRPLTDLASASEIKTLIMISPAPQHQPSLQEFQALESWVSNGGHLLIVERDLARSFGSTIVQTVAGSEQSPRILQPNPYSQGVEKIKLSEFPMTMTVNQGRFVEYFAVDENPICAEIQLGNGKIFVLSDPYIISNNGINAEDNVCLAINLATDNHAPNQAGVIAFDEFHHGYKETQSQYASLRDYFRGTPVPWLLGQVTLIGLAIVFTQGRRFARALPLKKIDRASSLEFVSAMANIQRAARARDLAMENIFLRFKIRLCHWVAISATATSEQIATAIMRKVGRNDPARTKSIKQLLTECDAIVKGGEVSEAKLLSLTRQMRDLEQEFKF